MKAIIPVAGTGTRLRPFTSTVPKPLLPVAGKPILAHILDSLLDGGVDEFIIVVGYMGNRIREFVESKYSIPIKFVEQEKLLGLGYAVHLGLKEVGDEPVLIALGDTIIELGIDRIINGGRNVIGVRKVDNPRRFGVVEMKGDRIIGLQEKPEHPKSNLAITGPYFFTDSEALKLALEYIVEEGIKTRDEFQLTDALQLIVEGGMDIYTNKIAGWFDCGTVETLIETNRHFLKRSPAPRKFDNAVIIPPVFIGENCILERCVVGPFVSIGNSVVIKDSVISDSIIGDGASVEGAFLKRSILGNSSAYQGHSNRLILGDHSQGGFFED